MSKPKLTYFDLSGSRGEECRLALHLGGVDFEDNRVNREQWLAMKPSSPFGGLPIFEVEGQPPLGQCNAILRLIGARHGLLPDDVFESARHEAMMAHVEGLRATVGPALFIADPTERTQARTKLREEFLPSWAAFAEKQITAEPFFGGAEISVADLKIYMAVRWLASGTVDEIPATIFDAYPKLNRIHDAVAAHPRVKAWVDAH